MFKALHTAPANQSRTVTSSLPLWNGSITYQGQQYIFTMVGTQPSTNTVTRVPVYIIPIKMVIATSTTPQTYNPRHVLANGNTVIENTMRSPIFDATTDYVQGGVDVGTTQYIDAYQRANFWGTVHNHTNYHLLLGHPDVLALQTMSPPAGEGAVIPISGINAGVVDIDWFDQQAQPLLSSLNIPENSLPIFLLYDVYLSSGEPSRYNCCIGGYHNYNGTQAYSDFTYFDVQGAFSQDVSALSHEVGEWADDPLTNNPSPCGILEVGDPLEGDSNYGAYPYTLNGFTYNLQDLVTLPYFGAPTTKSVNGWSTFQGTSISVCENGP